MQVIEKTENLPKVELGTPAPLQKRKRWFTFLAAAVGFCLITSLFYWVLFGSKHVTTDDAYAAADIAQVSSATDGIVKMIHVVDTQPVKAGDILVTLDETDAALNLKQAQANATHAESDLERARMNFERRKKLAPTGFISAEELSNAENAFKDAQATSEAAMAKLEQARVDFKRTEIQAPIDGVVAKRTVQLGQRVTSGSPLVSIVPLHEVYVNANFKEVQLRHVKVGQPVTLHADLYGSRITYHGRVSGISGGTGSSFAVIPAQNATGNWIKVVQRLPVRITIDPDNLAAHPLQVGLSMHADIYIGKTHS